MENTIKTFETHQPITISQKLIDGATAFACLTFFPAMYLIGSFLMG